MPTRPPPVRPRPGHHLPQPSAQRPAHWNSRRRIRFLHLCLSRVLKSTHTLNSPNISQLPRPSDLHQPGRPGSVFAPSLAITHPVPCLRFKFSNHSPVSLSSCFLPSFMPPLQSPIAGSTSLLALSTAFRHCIPPLRTPAPSALRRAHTHPKLFILLVPGLRRPPPRPATARETMPLLCAARLRRPFLRPLVFRTFRSLGHDCSLM